jgi:hypothetical protein
VVTSRAILQIAAKWNCGACNARWRELAQSQIAFNFQTSAQQQMHAGPMALGPNTINGDLRKQLG